MGARTRFWPEVPFPSVICSSNFSTCTSSVAAQWTQTCISATPPNTEEERWHHCGPKSRRKAMPFQVSVLPRMWAESTLSGRFWRPAGTASWEHPSNRAVVQGLYQWQTWTDCTPSGPPCTHRCTQSSPSAYLSQHRWSLPSCGLQEPQAGGEWNPGASIFARDFDSATVDSTWTRFNDHRTVGQGMFNVKQNMHSNRRTMSAVVRFPGSKTLPKILYL